MTQGTRPKSESEMPPGLTDDEARLWSEKLGEWVHDLLRTIAAERAMVHEAGDLLREFAATRLCLKDCEADFDSVNESLAEARKECDALRAEVARWKAEAIRANTEHGKAEAACAAMRAALEKLAADFESGPSGGFPLIAAEVHNRLAALSTDVGKGWVHPDVARQMAEALRYAASVHDPDAFASALEAYAKATQR